MSLVHSLISASISWKARPGPQLLRNAVTGRGEGSGWGEGQPPPGPSVQVFSRPQEATAMLTGHRGTRETAGASTHHQSAPRLATPHFQLVLGGREEILRDHVSRAGVQRGGVGSSYGAVRPWLGGWGWGAALQGLLLYSDSRSAAAEQRRAPWASASPRGPAGTLTTAHHTSGGLRPSPSHVKQKLGDPVPADTPVPLEGLAEPAF